MILVYLLFWFFAAVFAVRVVLRLVFMWLGFYQLMSGHRGSDMLEVAHRLHSARMALLGVGGRLLVLDEISRGGGVGPEDLSAAEEEKRKAVEECAEARREILSVAGSGRRFVDPGSVFTRRAVGSLALDAAILLIPVLLVVLS
ncbi:hypothetical protein NI17_006635 [Thermobifida halotolerans]|uniref:Uncharacterized protein n=1 Tax=Thermobifida halotolerans TaxID=483545 RepID=A0A399G6G5_9ACTN|nr:hypothetical protein [Thermobifida halotolerans]UOE20852.1 hypothetical protein NI17_006635 [Thermobifida halotolerans]